MENIVKTVGLDLARMRSTCIVLMSKVDSLNRRPCGVTKCYRILRSYLDA